MKLSDVAKLIIPKYVYTCPCSSVVLVVDLVDAFQVDDLLEDLPSENDEDESEEARSNVTGGDGNTTSFRDQLERELAVDTEGRSSAFVNQLCVMNDRLTALEEQGRNNLKVTGSNVSPNWERFRLLMCHDLFRP